MELFDKLNDLVKTAGEKTGSAIEIAKLTSQISKERDRIVLAKKGIGEVYYARVAEGYELLPEAEKYCEAIKAAEQAIQEAEEEIARIKAGPVVDEEQECVEDCIKFCPSCGARSEGGAAFCSVCGAKF